MFSPIATRIRSHCGIHTQSLSQEICMCISSIIVSSGCMSSLVSTCHLWEVWLLQVFVSLGNLLVHSLLKNLSKFIYIHQKCVCLLFAPFIVAILAGVESSQCLTGILAALPDISRGHNTVRQHLTMSDHILAAVPSVAFSIPPTLANFYAS